MLPEDSDGVGMPCGESSGRSPEALTGSELGLGGTPSLVTSLSGSTDHSLQVAKTNQHTSYLNLPPPTDRLVGGRMGSVP